VLAAEQRTVLLQALDRLREEDRLAIAYRYFFELSETEMVAALGWPRGTVKSHQRYAQTDCQPRVEVDVCRHQRGSAEPATERDDAIRSARSERAVARRSTCAGSAGA
jgi:hypothetical protein